MNRKEGIVMVAILLSTFIGAVFAAQNVPAIQQVFVTNFPKNQNVALQKTILVVEKQNITLAPCSCCGCPGGPVQFLGTSPVNSSLGFRQAFVYIHVDSVSPGTAGGIGILLINQKPSPSFPGDSTSTGIQLSGNGAVTNLTVSTPYGFPVAGEQFAFYLQPDTSTSQTFTNVSVSVFLEN